MKKNTGKHNNKFTGSRWLVLAFFCCAPLFTMADNNPPDKAESATAISTATVEVAPAPSAAAIPAYKPNLPSAPKTSTTWQLANLIGGLALILILIYGLSWFVKRFAQGGFMQTSSIKMLASLPLGTRERLMLVEVGGKQILLGVTAAQINSLHVFDEQVVQVSEQKASKPATSNESDFSQKMMAILQQKISGSIDSSQHKNIK